jgi:hypothetical protein
MQATTARSGWGGDFLKQLSAKVEILSLLITENILYIMLFFAIFIETVTNLDVERFLHLENPTLTLILEYILC